MHSTSHITKRLVNGEWICAECDPPETRRRPLTDHEKLKLSWYRSESKWIDNIKSRQLVKKNGEKFVVSNTGIMPRQPEQFYKNGGRVRG